MYDKDYEELKKLCHQLGVATPPRCFITVMVSKDGKELSKYQDRAHSWTRNGWILFFAAITNCSGDSLNTFGAGYMSGRNTSGTVFSSTSQIQTASSGYTTSVGSLGRGISIGTDNTAFDVDQYGLQAMIAHGTGEGQMTHQATVQAIPVYTGASKLWSVDWERESANNSGANIIVREIGLFAGVLFFGGGAYDSFLLARDVLGAAITVPNGGVVTVTFTMEQDYTDIDS